MADEPDPTASDDKDEVKVRQLREKAKRADDAEARVAELEAKLAARERAEVFAKAGLPDSKLAQKWATAYDGELTAEAVRKAALDDELIREEPKTSEPEQETHARMADLLNGTERSGQDWTDNVLASATKALDDLEAAGDLSPESVEAMLESFGLKATPSQ